jgi:hypothetical protein
VKTLQTLTVAVFALISSGYSATGWAQTFERGPGRPYDYQPQHYDKSETMNGQRRRPRLWDRERNVSENERMERQYERHFKWQMERDLDRMKKEYKLENIK